MRWATSCFRLVEVLEDDPVVAFFNRLVDEKTTVAPDRGSAWSLPLRGPVPIGGIS